MNFVSVEGNAATILNMNVSGIMDGTQKSERLEGGRLRVSFYCSDDAIAALQGLGLTVEIIADSGSIDTHLSALEDDSDGSAIV